MDKEAISTSVAYGELVQQHFNGGYFSEAVRNDVERIMVTSEDRQRELFADAFNSTYALAEKIQAHPRFNGAENCIDLNAEGLGVIEIDLAHNTDVTMDEDGVEPYKGIFVAVYAFSPPPRTRQEWINAPGDDLGLETAGPTTVQVDEEPIGWHEHVFADINGNFSPEDDKTKINYELLRLFDARETLKIVSASLDVAQQDQLRAA